jgi:hypothetical protein
MVTIAAPLRTSKTVPHTTAVSAVAVFRGQDADAMYPIKVVGPWEHLDRVSHVSLTFRAPRGFAAEVAMVEPAYVLCESRVVDDADLDPSAAPLVAGVEVVVRSEGEPFQCGVKFTDRTGTMGAVLGETGETLAFEAYSGRHAR